MNKILQEKYCTTHISYGPRGNYYDWCRYNSSNDTLEFGSEEGNYAGGVTLSYRWYGLCSWPEDHIPTEKYWSEVRKHMNYYKIKDGEFYNDIIQMLKNNDAKCIDKIMPGGRRGE